MDLSFTSAELAFHRQVSEFARTSFPVHLRSKMRLGQTLTRHELAEWQRILNARGWAVPAWPVEWGGTGWSASQLYLFKDALHRTPVPEAHNVSVNLIGSAIVAFGTSAQKKHFLPRIANLDDMWCQGFSEPNAGSDLAALSTQARREGDEYVVNGQKIWTSYAHEADWAFCLVRTSREASKQAGISFLLIDLRTPGIEVRPIAQIDQGRHLNEVFFTDVRVPVENRLGEENRGWDYAKALLGNERTGVARIGPSTYALLRAKALAQEVTTGNGGRLADDSRFRQRVASLEIALKALEITQLRVVAAQQKRSDGGRVDPAASVLKNAGAELFQNALELLHDVGGPFSLPFQDDFINAAPGSTPVGPDWSATLAPTYLLQRAATIYAGSNEIQHNIIAKAVLGL